MKEFFVSDAELDKLTDKEIEWQLENEDFQVLEDYPKKKRESVTVNGRRIRNSSHARKGILGALNRKRQKERQARFFRNVYGGGDQNKTRIVTEGDSWFNYPTKLKEIIDQIFDDYSLYSLGYGGDWLANIYKEEEYLKSVRLYKPDIFIISGGGNDMVGSRRMETILKKYKKGLQPEDLIIEKKFSSVIEDFRVLYKAIFDILHAEFPSLKIICHGYDYPYLDGKEKNWIGKPMRRKGIDDLEIRNGIGKILMDRFNEMLSQLSTDYERVFYVDVRGKVPRNKWKDELHPNQDGFEIIANIFRNKVSEITA